MAYFIANVNIPYVFNWTANIVHVINTRASCAEFQLEFQRTFNCIFTYSFICYYSYRSIVAIKRRYLRRDFINTRYPGYLKVARSPAHTYIYIHVYVLRQGRDCVYDELWLFVVSPTERRFIIICIHLYGTRRFIHTKQACYRNARWLW